MNARRSLLAAAIIFAAGSLSAQDKKPAVPPVPDYPRGLRSPVYEVDKQWPQRPEKIVLAGSRPATAHAATGKVVDIAYEGDRSLFRVAIDNGPIMLVATMNVARNREGAWRRGDTVWLGWADDAGQVLDE